MSDNNDLAVEIWMEMAQKQPKLEDMGKYIKKIVEWDPTLNEYDAVRICRFRQIYYDDLEKFLNIVYYYRHSRRHERSANDGMLLRLAEIASRIEIAEKTIRSEQKQERIAYFRILVETGIRHTQLMDLWEENLKGNQIELLDKKIGGNTVYVDLDGRLPEISDETKNMLVADEQGYYFHDTVYYYRMMIYAAMPEEPDIHIHDIRYFAQCRKAVYLNYKDLQRGKYVVHYKRSKRPRQSKDIIYQVELPVGLPPKHYGALYKKFGKYFVRPGVQRFTFNKREYLVQITKAAVFPQDYAAAMTIYPQIASYNRVVTVDIGGFTVDYLLLRGGKPDLSVCDSLEMGVITLYNRIVSRANSELDVLLDETDIDTIICDKNSDYSNSVIKLVKQMTAQYVEDLLGTFRERGIDLKTGCIVFIGGGSKLLKPYLENTDKVGKCVFIDDICANAKGYEILYQVQKKSR